MSGISWRALAAMIATYEEARKSSLANHDEPKKALVAATQLPDVVADNIGFGPGRAMRW